SPAFQKFIADTQAGATRQALTKTLIENFRIPAPQLSEQQRIAALLQDQWAAVERARAAAEARLEAANSLPAALLRDVFSSSDAKRWPRMPLGDLITAPLKTGISKPASDESPIRCLTLSAVRSGELDLSAHKRVNVSEEEAASNWVLPGYF